MGSGQRRDNGLLRATVLPEAMTEATPEQAARAFAEHEAFEEHDERFVTTTTPFDAGVLVGETNDSALRYRVLVEVPTLSAAVEESVADVVTEGWLDTFRLRLEDVSMAVPGDATITEPEARVEEDAVVVETTFHEGDADRAPRTAKAIVDYVEGTYVEGVVPGYEYRPPVSDMLASARHGGADDSETNTDGSVSM